MNTDKVYAESIAKEYAVKKDSKVVALKKLDAKIKQGPTIFTFSFGIISTLVLGVGMCLAMGVIGGGTTPMLILGIITGIIGIVGICVNYPIYTAMLNSRKKKYATDIMKLAKEITDVDADTTAEEETK